MVLTAPIELFPQSDAVEIIHLTPMVSRCVVDYHREKMLAAGNQADYLPKVIKQGYDSPE